MTYNRHVLAVYTAMTQTVMATHVACTATALMWGSASTNVTVKMVTPRTTSTLPSSQLALRFSRVEQVKMTVIPTLCAATWALVNTNAIVLSVILATGLTALTQTAVPNIRVHR